MRHGRAGKKFHRQTNERRALMRGLLANFIDRGQITTTETRAKSLRPAVERLVTRARRGDLASRRLLVSRLGSRRLSKKLMEDIAPRYQSRAGGYTRITKLAGRRRGDAARLAKIEWV